MQSHKFDCMLDQPISRSADQPISPYYNDPVTNLSAKTVYYATMCVFHLVLNGLLLVRTIYHIDVVGMTPSQLILAGTIYIGTIFFAEVPTGVVADAYSRKLSVIISFVLGGIGHAMEAVIPVVWVVYLSHVIVGISRTFLSGAFSAWLADEIGEDDLQATMMRGQQISEFIAILGIIGAMFVGSQQIMLTFWLGGAALALWGLLLIVLMPETNYTPAAADERQTWRKLAVTFRTGWAYVTAKVFFLLIFIIEVGYGISAPVLQRLTDAHLLESFVWPTQPNWTPIIWLGIISIAKNLLNVGVLEWLKRNVADKSSAVILRTLVIINVIYVTSVLLFAFAQSFVWGVAGFLFVGVSQYSNFNLYDPWLIKQISSEVRATVMSMWKQSWSLGFLIGGSVLGVWTDLVGIRYGYASIVLFLLPALLIFNRMRREQLAEERS